MSKRLQQELLPVLEDAAWEDRPVYPCFDADIAEKPLVRLALSRLSAALINRGAVIHDNAALPMGPLGKMDDFIAAYGPAKFQELVEAAKEAENSAELHRLNGEVAVVWGGGVKGNIVRLGDGEVLTPNQFARVLYKDRTYTKFALTAKGAPAQPRRVCAAEEWLGWPQRQTVSAITYAPGRPKFTCGGEYNIYRPSQLVPAKGDISPWLDLQRRMLKELDAGHVTWFRRWLAYPLRFPGTKMFSCVLVWSFKGGTGKNLLAETMLPVYGEHNCTTIKSRHLLSDFNGWAEGKQFIIGDEVTLDDKRHTSGELKSMLTNRVIRINRKGIESYELPDCTNYYFTSNDAVAIVLEPGERRTFVVHASEEPLGDAYGRAYAAWLREGGAAAVAWHLIHELDMGDFSPTQEPPDTVAKHDLIASSLSEVDTWATAVRLDPTKYLTTPAQKFAAGNGHRAAPFTVYTPEDLLRLYDPEDKKRVGLRALGIALRKAGFNKATHNNGRLNNVRSTFWLIGTERQLTSSQAAEIYKKERPKQFVPPSQRDARKEKVQ